MTDFFYESCYWLHMTMVADPNDKTLNSGGTCAITAKDFSAFTKKRRLACLPEGKKDFYFLYTGKMHVPNMQGLVRFE